jgi:enoyl-CoA hydratase/carnithine racemase
VRKVSENTSIKVEKDYPLVWIIINREKYANALGSKDMFDLKDTIENVCKDENAKTIALIGSGEKYFTSGVDLNEISNLDDVGKSWNYLYKGLGGVIKAILDCRVPVIAAINGYAIGAGFDLIYATDMAYAVKTAKLGVTAVKWGLIPPITSTIGFMLANSKAVSYLGLTGELITAEEAIKYGFINDVVENIDSLKSKVKDIAAKISKNDNLAVEQIKSLISSAKLNPYIYAGSSAIAAFGARKETKEKIRSSFKK